MMLFTKPTICSNTGVLFSLCSSSPATSSCWSRGRTRESSSESASASQSRSYASVVERDRNEKDTKWPASAHPTPYEIFDLGRDAPYSKLRFYELVKVYHPDRRRHTAHDGIPHITKLERYRLVIAANNILSDPEKRRLYNLTGTGWGTQPDLRSAYRAADRKWREEPGNPSMNATWEDWERWHDRRNGKKQEPVYVSNGTFVGIIALFVLVGTWEQVTRAGTHSVHLMDMRDRTDIAVSKELQQRQSQLVGLDRDDRVQTFLRQREAWGYDQPSRRRQRASARVESPSAEHARPERLARREG
ncbi:hypothetical protein B0T22DRAFT_173291 [Podospora appendiculata]|uniref:J domain-containing protein n=1 Tax=Podospora appendiculata TaxID=314037 RepID=A0AAE1CDL4_9PEZI|nr:hypothetical protein B0T22DRAFT_173291 [Podospora appendiculata]